jgi:YegS/Rv2252/BmrU family lipid kinase
VKTSPARPRTLFIVNPAAGGGRARRVWAVIEREALRACAPAEVVWTKGPGDGTHLARDAAASGAALVIAVGGDGTIHEIVNGLVDPGEPRACSAALGMIAAGTGRDFARTLRLPSDSRGQLDRVIHGTARSIDIGRVAYSNGGRTGTRLFVNVASFGLSGVTDRLMSARLARWCSARAAFQVAVLRALLVYRNARVQLRVDGGRWQTHTVKVAAIANGRYFGGGMQIAPRAEPDDGLLECVVVGDVSLARLARRFGSVYRGEHLTFPEVAASRGQVIIANPMEVAPAVTLDIDGEGIGALPAVFEVLPRALVVRC